MIRQKRGRAANRTIGNAEPQQGGVERSGMSGGCLRTHLRGERARSPKRRGRRARYDLGDGETGVVQRHCQKSRQAPGADDGYGGLIGCRFSAHRRSIPYIVVMAKSAGLKSAGMNSARARVLSSRISYQGPVFSVTTDEVEEPGGVRARRDVIRHSGSVVVLAIADRTSDDRTGTRPAKAARKDESRILLERQYRHAAQSMMWELP